MDATSRVSVRQCFSLSSLRPVRYVGRGVEVWLGAEPSEDVDRPRTVATARPAAPAPTTPLPPSPSVAVSPATTDRYREPAITTTRSRAPDDHAHQRRRAGIVRRRDTRAACTRRARAAYRDWPVAQKERELAFGTTSAPPQPNKSPRSSWERPGILSTEPSAPQCGRRIVIATSSEVGGQVRSNALQRSPALSSQSELPSRAV